MRSYKEKILLSAILLSLIGMIPFTGYRFATGDFLIGILDATFVLVISSLFYYVWRTHKIQIPSLILCTSFLSVIVVVVNLRGPDMVYAIFPVILGCYCLLNVSIASMLIVMVMLLIFPALYANIELFHMIFLYVITGMISVFSYIFTILTTNHETALSQLATQDGLTDLRNRRSLDTALGELFSKHKRKPLNASLIIIDIDHFKKINDKFGHLVGDDVLIKLASMLKGEVKRTDQVYRYGGEEFVLLLEDCDLDESAEVAERIRSRVETSQILDHHSVTISLGIAEIKQSVSEVLWLNLADDALYAAKNNGRNQCQIALTKKAA